MHKERSMAFLVKCAYVYAHMYTGPLTILDQIVEKALEWLQIRFI